MGRRSHPARRDHQHRRRAGAPGRRRRRQHGRRRRGGDAASAFGGRRRPRPGLRRARERAPGFARHRLGARTARDPPARRASGSGRDRTRPSGRRGRVRPRAHGPRRPRSRDGRPHALMRRHPIFAPLAEATLEQLSRRLESVEVGAGHGGDPSGRPRATASTSSYRASWPWTWTAGRARTSARATSSARSRSCATCLGRRASARVTDRTLVTLVRDEFLAAVTGTRRAPPRPTSSWRPDSPRSGRASSRPERKIDRTSRWRGAGAVRSVGTSPTTRSTS